MHLCASASKTWTIGPNSGPPASGIHHSWSIRGVTLHRVSIVHSIKISVDPNSWSMLPAWCRTWILFVPEEFNPRFQSNLLMRTVHLGHVLSLDPGPPASGIHHSWSNRGFTPHRVYIVHSIKVSLDPKSWSMLPVWCRTWISLVPEDFNPRCQSNLLMRWEFGIILVDYHSFSHSPPHEQGMKNWPCRFGNHSLFFSFLSKRPMTNLVS